MREFSKDMFVLENDNKENKYETNKKVIQKELKNINYLSSFEGKFGNYGKSRSKLNINLGHANYDNINVPMKLKTLEKGSRMQIKHPKFDESNRPANY